VQPEYCKNPDFEDSYFSRGKNIRGKIVKDFCTVGDEMNRKVLGYELRMRLGEDKRKMDNMDFLELTKKRGKRALKLVREKIKENERKNVRGNSKIFKEQKRED
jgi:hypothetical protein